MLSPQVHLQIFIFFPEDAKVGVKSLKVYLERMKESNAFRAILVVQQNLTAFGKGILAQFAPKYIVEVVSRMLHQQSSGDHNVRLMHPDSKLQCFAGAVQ